MVAGTTERNVTELLKKLEAVVEAQARELKILREENALLKRGMFGRRSERLEPGQLGFFDLESEPLEKSSSEPATKTRKKKEGHGRAHFPPNLPREVIDVDVAEADRKCACCGKAMKRIGEEITERGHCIPARIVVKRYVRPKYACPEGHSVMTAALPDGVIDGGKYEASVYAHVATAKYADHMPLHRLEGIFKRQGVHLAKQSMWDMLLRVDEIVAQPVLKQMRVELLEEPVLHADETPVTMRLEDGKGSKKGYAWASGVTSNAASQGHLKTIQLRVPGTEGSSCFRERGLQVLLGLSSPAPGAALQDVGVVQEAIEQGRDSRCVSQQLAPVLDWAV